MSAGVWPRVRRTAYALSGSWAQLRAAMAGFPDGTVFLLDDLWGFGTQWIKKGAYLLPQGGEQSIVRDRLDGVSTTATTLGPVSGYTSPVIPWPDLMAVPGFSIVTEVGGFRSSPQTAQPVTVNTGSLWPSDDQGLVALEVTNNLAGINARGLVQWLSPTTYVRCTGNNAFGNAPIAVDTRPLSNITAASAITLLAKTGGAGETINFSRIQVRYRA